MISLLLIRQQILCYSQVFYSKRSRKVQTSQVHFQLQIVEIDTNLKPLVLISGNIEAIKALLGVSIDNMPIKGEETQKDDLQNKREV